MHLDVSNQLAARFHPSEFAAGRYEDISRYMSYTCYVANAVSDAVANHLRESAPPVMPDVSDPAVIARTLFEFFGGKISVGDGLQLVLIPADKKSDHKNIVAGKSHEVGASFLLNALNMVLGVPLNPVRRDGKIVNLDFDRDHFFCDVASMEKWLRVRAARKAA